MIPERAPSVMMTGTVIDAMTIYVAVVGRPMPMIKLAIAVINKSMNILPADRISTIWTIMLPIPIVTIPTTIPAHAVARATESILREPEIKPLPIVLIPSINALRIFFFSLLALIKERIIIITMSTTIALKAANLGVCLMTISS